MPNAGIVRKTIDLPKHPSSAKCVVIKTMLTATLLGTSEQGLCVNKPNVANRPSGCDSYKPPPLAVVVDIRFFTLPSGRGGILILRL